MRLGVAVAVACLSAIGLSLADDVKASIRRPTNIPAEALGPALQTLAKERGFQVAYVSDEVDSRRTQGAVGELTTNEALTKLLSGTGLTYRYFGDRAVSIIPIGSVDASGGASTQAQVEGSGGARSPAEEGKKTSSDGFRVAQVDQGQTAGPSTVEKQDEQAAKKKRIELEEVVVTGSRLAQTATEGAQQVKVYTREQITQSGQTTLADFLNTLPSASISMAETAFQTLSGTSATTVRLHGLPIGTTLVLIDGRRVEASGAQYAAPFFDLNTIPLGVVERIEVISEGSSAVYGSDAIAGVVNIILKHELDGFEGNVKDGWASGMHDTTAGLGWGNKWDKGSLLISGSFQDRGELEGFKRSLTSNSDYTAFGGSDNRGNDCRPGSVFTLNGTNLPGIGAPQAAVPAGYTGPPTQQEFLSTAGTLNKCSIFGYNSYIPETHRGGVLASGNYRMSSSIELFAEMMFSHTKDYLEGLPPLLDGFPRFHYAQYTVSASNPYNPFGETVGVTGLLTDIGRRATYLDTNFIRPVIGTRGSLFGSWSWEISGWYSENRSTESFVNSNNNAAIQAALNSTNPATALNPFVDALPGSLDLLRSLVTDGSAKYVSSTEAATAFLRGPILHLPAGTLDAVFGVEQHHDKLDYDLISEPGFAADTQQSFKRDTYSMFAEARVPILATGSNSAIGDTLEATLAARYDHYSDFGDKTTPQFGMKWLPLDTLLIRGTYGKAFRAPSLFDLYQPVLTFPGQFVADPRNGNQLVAATVTNGGNPHLNSETGHSSTFGLVYSSKAVSGLQVSASYWHVDLDNSVQYLGSQTIVDNEKLFPGNIVRNASGTITQVNSTAVNFGAIKVAGLDYQVLYRALTKWGQLSPSIGATETTRYSVALQPGALPTERVRAANDDGLWAPRWKGMAALTWKSGQYTAALNTRYVGSYQDYDSTRSIGNFWLCDANVHVDLGRLLTVTPQPLKRTYFELGGVNIFNRLPQFSNFHFGVVGYDPAQADIRGRFLYAQIGITL